jgi:hypothetical protein
MDGFDGLSVMEGAGHSRRVVVFGSIGCFW